MISENTRQNIECLNAPSRQLTSVISVKWACILRCCIVSLKKRSKLPQGFAYSVDSWRA